MVRTDPIRLGLVGIGRAGWGMHGLELEGKEDKFRFVAACDILADRRERMAQKYGCKTYKRIEDLVADPEVEMVDIATRSVDHFAHAAVALKAGKDVFLEKPMCATYAEAKRLVALAAKSKGNLYIRQNRRTEPAFLHIRQIIASGILGDVYEIKLARVSYSRRDDWQTLTRFGGGQLLNWGPHIVDHALQLLEAPVESQWSERKRIAAVGDAEDYFKIILRGTNGRIVEAQISGGAAVPIAEWVIWGTRGGLVCTGNRITVRYLDPKVKLPPRKVKPGAPGTTSFGTPEELPWIEQTFEAHPENPWDIWDALYSAVRQGTRLPIALNEVLEVMKFISSAKKGARFQTAARRPRRRSG